MGNDMPFLCLGFLNWAMRVTVGIPLIALWNALNDIEYVMCSVWYLYAMIALSILVIFKAYTVDCYTQ